MAHRMGTARLHSVAEERAVRRMGMAHRRLVEGDRAARNGDAAVGWAAAEPCSARTCITSLSWERPSEKDPWMLQFGGHHLALNITIAGEHGILTPTLTGAQPALYTVNGKTVRPLGQESDKAIALLNALNDTQRKQAILNYRVADLVLGPDRMARRSCPKA